MTEDQGDVILEVRNLRKYFTRESSIVSHLFGSVENVHAVDDVSFKLRKNEVKGVIGESGCGKTTLLHLLSGLVDLTDGDIQFGDQQFSEFSRADWKAYRRNVQIIFQDPFNSLDPKMSVRESLLEPLKIHGFDDREQRVIDALSQAELNPPEQYLNQLPRNLSGGEKQRVSIARALIVEPQIILADEPVSMLDVSTQASLLNLLSELTEKRGMSMLYISHDLSTVSYVCDEINVMYLGRIVERANTEALLQDPKHPYSQALINAIPVPDPNAKRERTEIEADPPDPVNIGEGCRFRDRCPDRMDICEKTPILRRIEDGREAACHLYYDHGALPSEEMRESSRVNTTDKT
jgi:peptide/nickel transport system ATP-binding protein